MSRPTEVSCLVLRDERLVDLMRQVLAVSEADLRTAVRDAARTIGVDLERQMRSRWGAERAARVLESLNRELAGRERS